jgi:hypothetical protein
MTSPAARARCPAMPPGWTTDASVSRAGERTGMTVPGCQSGAAPGGGRRGRGAGKGLVCEDGGFWPPGQ